MKLIGTNEIINDTLSKSEERAYHGKTKKLLGAKRKPLLKDKQPAAVLSDIS
jgi:hypothetical protein